MFTREKQNIRKFIGLALVLIILIAALAVLLPSPARAYAETANELRVSDFVLHTKQDNEYESFISNQDLAQLKSALEKSHLSKTEIYKEIYRELDYSNNEIDKIGIDEISLIMESSIAITVNQQYLSIDENGNQKILSKEECLIAANAVNAQRESALQERILQAQNNQFSSQEDNDIGATSAATGNDSLNEQTIGYMKITTRSDYINPSTVNNQQGWYNFSATYEWLTTPKEGYTDAFSLYAAGCAWSQGSTDIYSKVSYNWWNLNGSISGNTDETSGFVEIEKYAQDRNVQSTGVYYTYSVPISYSIIDPYYTFWILHNVSNLNYYVRAKARVSNYTIPQVFNVFSRYEHLRKSVNVNADFNWSLGSWPGVGVSVSVGDKHDAYTSYNYTEYDPNFAGNLAYNLISNGTAYEVAGIGSVTATSIEIPATFNGKPVTAIAANAFSGMTQLSQISIPASVTSIGQYAFSNCFKLTTINIPDGRLMIVTDNGEVYKMAGNAPIYVQDWNHIGGSAGKTWMNIPRDFYNLLRQYPKDGTLVEDHWGDVYVFAGGAPLYVNYWNNIGGEKPVVYVDGVSLRNYSDVGQFSHVRQYPKDGTVVQDHLSDVYVFAGGAPLYVNYWNNIGGEKPVVHVDGLALRNYSDVGQFSHVRQYPKDGTVVQDHLSDVYVFAGGAPLYVSNWNNIGGEKPVVYVDGLALRNYSDVGKFSHVRQRPLDGTIVQDHLSDVYIFVGAAPLYVSCWNNIGGEKPVIYVDGVSLRSYDDVGKFSHVRQRPLDGTLVSTIHGKNYSYTGGIAYDHSLWSSLPPYTLIDPASL